MKETTKRILSLILAFVMVLGLLPGLSLNVSAAGDVIDAAVFCSDVHGSTSDLTSVMGGVATSGVDYSSIGFVGDTCLTVENTTSIVQSALSDTKIAVMFSYASSHDTEDGADIDENWDYSGEVEGVSKNYLVYTIRETDMQNDNGAEADFTSWYNGLTEAEKALPIFILSHRPLHARRNDNAGAAAWYNAISTAAESSDIVFFWGHNHTSESDVDTAAYYVAKDGSESFTVYNGKTVVPNFTYMNAGYINAANQNPARKGVATTVQITADSLIFQDYNSSGAYTGTYAHNVEVAREFASAEPEATEPSVPEATAPEETTVPETTAPEETTVPETTVPEENTVPETTDPTEGGIPAPETATGSGSTTTTTKKTVYVLTSSISSGNEYLIVNGNSAGSYYALANNSGSVAATGVTVKTDSEIGTYIELDDAADELWTVSNSYRFQNNGYYLRYNNGLGLSSSKYTTWSYSSNRLYYSSSGSTRYLRYNSGWTTTSKSNSASSIYFYIPTEVEVETTTDVSGTYSIAGNPAEVTKVVTNGSTVELGSTLTFVPTDGGTATTTDTSTTATYAIYSDPDGILSGIDGNTVTFTGSYGEALVKVSYEVSFGEEKKTVTNYITVTASEPYYSLDLHKQTADADGNPTAGEEITAPIAIKGVEAGDTYPLWAVIKEYTSENPDGLDIGTLTEEQLKNLNFISSDPSVATVDPTTGVVTFTGKEGTVEISAYYEYAEGKQVTDKVTFSVTPNNYVLPEDGSNDFPEYPNEGAIRIDKNAAAVGAFSQTGIAQVELSMTGVPYSEGSEIDVVVMLDMTGSMSDDGMEAAELATIAFMEKIVKNEDGSYNENRIAVYAFNSGSSSPYELVSLDTITSDSELATATTAIKTASNKQASGGTPFDEAASKCHDVLEAAKTDGTGNDRQQFCVFMSDGGPTTYEGSDGYTYYGGNASGDRKITSYIDGYTSSSSSSWTYNLPTEYYTDHMKSEGVTVYTVGLLLQNAPSNPSPYSSMTDSTYDSATDSLTSIGSHYYFTSTILKNMASDSSKYIDIFDVDNADKATAAFETIAKSIREAAKDVIVADQITDEYTMIFDIPEGTMDINGLPAGQEFYIEVKDYAMTAVDDDNDGIIDDYTRGTGTTLMKLYLGQSGSSYYAATDASGTAYDAPVFGTTPIGTMFYWTTDPTDTGISVTVGGVTYNFHKTGISNTDDAFNAAKWFNMTSGAYATGTIDPVTNTSTDLILATPYFAYNAQTRMLYWTAEKLSSNELAISYFLYLDRSATEIGNTGVEVDPGTYPTNVGATITYTNFQDNRCQKDFPIPKLTWKGAQVSYVFYLVNENGQPVNRAGRVVPFSEAVYVTNVYTHSVVWNAETGVDALDADELARDLVPSVYSLYDNDAYYEIHVYQTPEDEEQDHFIIEGSSDVSNQNTTKVFNVKSDASHRYSAYGAYSNVGGEYTSTQSNTKYTANVVNDFDYCNTTVAFAVVWTQTLKEDVVVVDYGLDVVINVSANDAVASGVVGVRDKAPANVDMNEGTYDAQKDTSAVITIGTGDSAVEIGTASVENLTSVRFSLNKESGMEFWTYADFFYEAEVNYYDDQNVLQTKGMYSQVTVIPATTIYYEDDFVTYESYTWNGKWQQVDESSDKWVWSEPVPASSDTQAQDRPGEQGNVTIGSGLDADNIYGYDGAYTNMSTHSMGSAMKATVNYDNRGIASFTFYGTGFDVISMTSNATGSIYLEVLDQDGNLVVDRMVDTYYGYTRVLYNVTYKYEQVNVGTEAEPEYKYQWIRYKGEPAAEGAAEQKAVMPEEAQLGDEVTGVEYVWVENNDARNSIYQVPVIQANDLEYGKYTARIIASYDEHYDHVAPSNATGSYDFYLDAIRIYDPAHDGVSNDTIRDAYLDDHEGWPSYIELRDNLIAAAEIFDSTTGEITGMVFIDGDPEVDSAQLSDYVSYGPNNEVYLAPDQRVAFRLAVPGNIDRIHMGIKSADGQNVTYSIRNIAADGKDYGEMVDQIDTASDMYYDITGYKNDIVVIENTGDSGILSITNIKSTYTSDPNAAANGGVVPQSLADERFETYIYMTAEDANLTVKALKPAPVNPFADIDIWQFFYECVLWAVENGITNGISDSHFGPYLNCNRAQVVTFLWRANGSPAPASRVNPFVDVPEDSWYTDAVLWAVEKGITNGLTADTFGPDVLCNRAQVVTFLWRANGSMASDGAANHFDDVSAGTFYHDAVSWAVGSGITTGASASEFDPNGICMRAHVVTFLYRAEQLPELAVSGWTSES